MKIIRHFTVSSYHSSVEVSRNLYRGIDFLNDRSLNKGLSFSLEERQELGILGLLPAAYRTAELQEQLCVNWVQHIKEPIQKYIYATELWNRNERLFFRLLARHTSIMMPIVYTPTVGLACQHYGEIYRKHQGLFVTINDKDHVLNVIYNWPESHVKVIVVTDGERILGLGDLGAHGMGIPVGKLALYTALGGIQPYKCLPVVLDVGTNNESLLKDPYYVGVRKKRPPMEQYDALVDEFMKAVVKRYGQDTLIQFEDFGNANAFRLLKKYKDVFCVFNDDIQGTAGIAVAGLFASQRITQKKLHENKILFFGAGGAAMGIADLVALSIMKENKVSKEEAAKNIWMIDIHGLLVSQRKEPVDDHLKVYAHDHKPMKGLLEIVKELKPNTIIGVSTVGKAFTPEVIKELATINDRPVIFALSNPTEKAECTATDAYTHSEGRCVFSSGSPFDPVTVHGKTFRPGQGNNAYIFPGVGLGVIVSGMHHIPDDLFLIAAQTTAESVSEKDLNEGALYPPLSEVPKLSVEIAKNIMEFAYNSDLATAYPKPADKTTYIKSQLYDYCYQNNLAHKYNYPS
ncbi:NADP-dependent malic enzyme-like [Lycorma delicatula]|uniref:NADP-dependent malic enzyme-like n=1 Tax=Lycorma delicatula TaxID=130591 RepID=UPI003F516D97